MFALGVSAWRRCAVLVNRAFVHNKPDKFIVWMIWVATLPFSSTTVDGKGRNKEKYGLSFEGFDPPFFVDNRWWKREDRWVIVIYNIIIKLWLKIPLPNNFWIVNIKYHIKSQHCGLAIYQLENYDLNSGKKVISKNIFEHLYRENYGTKNHNATSATLHNIMIDTTSIWTTLSFIKDPRYFHTSVIQSLFYKKLDKLWSVFCVIWTSHPK